MSRDRSSAAWGRIRIERPIRPSAAKGASRTSVTARMLRQIRSRPAAAIWEPSARIDRSSVVPGTRSQVRLPGSGAALADRLSRSVTLWPGNIAAASIGTVAVSTPSVRPRFRAGAAITRCAPRPFER